MISFSVLNSEVHVSFNYSPLFDKIVNVCKLNRLRFSPDTKTWICSLAKYEDIKSKLENIDVVNVESYVENQIKILKAGKPDLKITTERVKVNYDLMNYLPLVGKPPYERFQYQDIQNGLQRNRYLYALGMGTGKSYITATIIANLRHWGKIKKTLIITSNIGLYNLKPELLKFTKGLKDEDIVEGDSTNREPFSSDAPIIITSYDYFRLICEHYYKKTNKRKPGKLRKGFLPIEKWLDGADGCFILDESHHIANPESKQSNYVLLHAEKFEYRYLFSGTPFDKIQKQYTQFRFLDKALVHNYSYKEWLEEYAILGNHFSAYAISDWKYDKIKELNQRVLEYYGVFRNTEDVIDLPEHYRKKVYIEMGDKQKQIYEYFITNALQEIDKEFGSLRTRDVVNKFPYMMLAVENPLLLEKHKLRFSAEMASEMINFNYKKNYEKLNTLNMILKDHEDEKGILWTVHPKTTEILAEYYKDYDPVIITTQIEKRERKDLIEKFEKGPHRLLIAGVPLINTSVTITGASFQVYIERPFNYTQYSQSIKRIYRYGQKRAVHTYVLIYQNTLDVLIDKNLEDKNLLDTKLLSRDFLTKQEWKRIFTCNSEDNLMF